MRNSTWNLDHGPLRGLYRDRENGWIFGVCAGVADFLNIKVGPVRIVVAVSLLLFFWPIVIVYVAATLVLKEKPLLYSGREAEYEFWRRSSCRDRWSDR